MQQVKAICVCGAGTMGSGIAQVCAQAGLKTILFDTNEGALEKARQNILQSLQKLQQKGKLQDADTVMEKIFSSSEETSCIADVIIEAIIENKNAKAALFKKLAALNNEQTIFATNTSSISVSEIANELPHPQRVAGMHFFNPVLLMKLVEIVRAETTDDATITTLVQLAKQLNKFPVVCKDAPGFIVNRVARPYYLEALKLAEEKKATVENIDKILEATGFKMGPFKLMDLIGMDINYSVSNIVWEAMGKPKRLTPSALQKQKVDEGNLGRKTGKGFYDYKV
ncbi:MAG TPA: 3-hydroxyacyl-CoA dehydrogenase NAD-binding domain-containing protein [Chitinophagaceae bacterium]|nr:3-hydroxyacyl-CoA dehydrogenase NAD-binding domain-containing protein [Chitinophagaceae bacterium]